MGWQIEGDYFESCNCEAICLCRTVGGVTGGRSTYGECLGVLSWGLGQAGWVYLESFRGDEVPFPSQADLGYLGMVALTTHKKEMFQILGLPREAPTRRGSVDTTRVVVDTSAIIDGPIADIVAAHVSVIDEKDVWTKS